MFLNVNSRLIFLTLPILPSHVSSPRLRITFQLDMARYSFILYCIVLYCLALYCATVSDVPLTKTTCSAIAERQRCSVRYSFGQNVRLELGDNILRT